MTGRRRRIRLDLALRGGGTHGAFTWGVLDRPLEEEHIEIVAISGASSANVPLFASYTLRQARQSSD